MHKEKKARDEERNRGELQKQLERINKMAIKYISIKNYFQYEFSNSEWLNE